MTQFLPPNLLALFAPRDPIPYLAPTAKLPHEKNTPGYSGVAQFMTDFEVSQGLQYCSLSTNEIAHTMNCLPSRVCLLRKWITWCGLSSRYATYGACPLFRLSSTWILFLFCFK